MPTKHKHLDSSKGLFGRYADYMHDSFEKARGNSILKKASIGFRKAINNARSKALSVISNNITPEYIGGDSNTARKKLWEQEPILSNAVDSVANRYGIDSNALRYRLNHEGIVDAIIKMRNYAVQNPKFSNIDEYRGYNLLYNPKFAGGVSLFGLDDVGTLINEGKVQPINESWYDQDFTNEHGRQTHGATSPTPIGNIGLTAATLKYFIDKAKEDNPKLSAKEASRYGLAYYNRGIVGGRKWAKAGAIGYDDRTKYKTGGTIHIKPKNRGKFNALKKRTGKTTEELTHSKNPLTRKRAIFAQNARKWNHKKK